MKEIKYFVHDNSIYTYPHYAPLANICSMLRELEQVARQSVAASGAAHAVYAVKKYDADGEISAVDFYCPPVCLVDKDFYERTDAEMAKNPGCLIYATHAHK